MALSLRLCMIVLISWFLSYLGPPNVVASGSTASSSSFLELLLGSNQYLPHAPKELLWHQHLFMPASWQFTILSTRLVRVPLLLQRIWFRQIRVAFCLVPLMFIMQFVIIFCVWQVRMPKLQVGFLLMRVPFLAALSSGFKNHLLTGDCISCGHNVSPPVGLCLILATLPLAICIVAVPSLFIMPVAEPSTSVLLEC